jgi:hypothetical protein
LYSECDLNSANAPDSTVTRSTARNKGPSASTIFTRVSKSSPGEAPAPGTRRPTRGSLNSRACRMRSSSTGSVEKRVRFSRESGSVRWFSAMLRAHKFSRSSLSSSDSVAASGFCKFFWLAISSRIFTTYDMNTTRDSNATSFLAMAYSSR